MQALTNGRALARQHGPVSIGRREFGSATFAPSASNLRSPQPLSGAGSSAPPGRILVVEDRSRAQPIQLSLEEHGYRTHVAGSALECEGLDFTARFDAILLNAVLPDCDGVDFCRRLRQHDIGTPILVLSTVDSIAAKVRVLDAGADACLTVPLQTEELLARLRSCLRRFKVVTGTVIRSGDLVMNLEEHRVTLADVLVTLTSKEFALLHYMMRNPRKLLTRAMLVESVWDTNYIAGSNVVDVYVCSLRRKVDRDPHRRRIETVIGSGYRFVDNAEERMPTTSVG